MCLFSILLFSSVQLWSSLSFSTNIFDWSHRSILLCFLFFFCHLGQVHMKSKSPVAAHLMSRLKSTNNSSTCVSNQWIKMQWQREVLRKYIFSLSRVNWEKFKSSLFNLHLNCSLKSLSRSQVRYKFKRQVQALSHRPWVLKFSRQIINQETSWIKRSYNYCLSRSPVRSQLNQHPTLKINSYVNILKSWKKQVSSQPQINWDISKSSPKSCQTWSPIYYHIKCKSS